MQRAKHSCLILLILLCFVALVPESRANPYPDPRAGAQDRPIFYAASRALARRLFRGRTTDTLAPGESVLRVTLHWDSTDDAFAITDLVRERSGTQGLALRAQARNPF